MKPAHLAPKSKSHLRTAIVTTAITALLASGVVALTMPASATTATALADGERLTFVPTASDHLAATTTNTRTNSRVEPNGDILAPAQNGDSYRYKNVHPTFADVDAVVTVEDIVNLEDTAPSPDVPDRLEILDEWSVTSDINRFIRIEADTDNSNLHGTAKIKVEFYVSGTNTRVTFPTLGVNAYDIDDNQFIEFEGHTSKQLFSSSHVVESVPRTGVERFTAPLGEDTYTTGGIGSDTATAYTVGRVKANYTNAHTVVFSVGAWGGSAFEMDFGPGVSWGSGQAPSERPVTQSSGGGSSSPVKVVTNVSPTQVTASREIITLTGQNLDTATEVFIGGIKARIVSKANGKLQVKPPKGLKGFVDLELKGTLNPVSRIKALEYLTGKAASAVRKAEIVVGGFDHNSRVLTSRIKTRIERLIDKYPELQTVTCTGFTSLPRRANDVRLSTNRGVEACRFAKAYKPSLVVEVEQGIEDPRPGSNVRRVRVALSQ